MGCRKAFAWKFVMDRKPHSYNKHFRMIKYSTIQSDFMAWDNDWIFKDFPSAVPIFWSIVARLAIVNSLIKL
jgi:hypothetical protein